MIDWDALMLVPIYSTIGVPAQIEFDSAVYDVTVVDKTTPQAAGNNIEMQTFYPSVCVRAKELAEQEVDLEEIDNKVITFSGKSWTIKNHQAIHSPNGQEEGEQRLVLEEV